MTSDVEQLASRLNGDWRALLRARVNVLVVGPEDIQEAFRNACRDEVRPPVACVLVGTPLLLPWASTLVLVDVERLDGAGQSALACWMNDPRNADAQIISFTSTSLYPFVLSGQFDRALYYRLNTIHLRLTEATTH